MGSIISKFSTYGRRRPAVAATVVALAIAAAALTAAVVLATGQHQWDVVDVPPTATGTVDLDRTVTETVNRFGATRNYYGLDNPDGSPVVVDGRQVFVSLPVENIPSPAAQVPVWETSPGYFTETPQTDKVRYDAAGMRVLGGWMVGSVGVVVAFGAAEAVFRRLSRPTPRTPRYPSGRLTTDRRPFQLGG
jgi:hypothetical protein